MGQFGKSYRATILFTRFAGIQPRPLYAQLLSDQHYQVIELAHGARSTSSVDVILVDALSLGILKDTDVDFLKELKIQHPESAMMFLTDITAPYSFRQQLKRHGTVCPTGDQPRLILPKLQRLLENLSLADECGDRLKTLSSLNRATASRNGLAPSSAPANVLVTGALSPILMRIFSSLEDHGFNLTFALSVPQTVRYLEYRQFDSLVIVPGNKDGIYTSLVKLLRRNEKTKTLPVLVFAQTCNEDELVYRYLQQGADIVLGENDIDEAIMPEVRSFARRNRLTKSMRQFLRKSVPSKTTAQTFICDLAFFEAHLARQCATSSSHSRHLCVSVFQLKTASGMPVTPPLSKQAVSYVELMIQDTDLMTVVRDDLVLLSQPGTALIDANTVRKRIVNLLQELKFKSGFAGDQYEDLDVWSGTVGFAPHEVPEEMIARALSSLTETPRPNRLQTRPQLTLVQ